jgi:hypothetical protein
MTPCPPDADSPSGEPWWQLRIWPSKKKAIFGSEPKIAAWLMFNTKVGGIFTLKRLREALGDDGEPNDDEHLNRRLRPPRMARTARTVRITASTGRIQDG